MFTDSPLRLAPPAGVAEAAVCADVDAKVFFADFAFDLRSAFVYGANGLSGGGADAAAKVVLMAHFGDSGIGEPKQAVVSCVARFLPQCVAHFFGGNSGIEFDALICDSLFRFHCGHSLCLTHSDNLPV